MNRRSYIKNTLLIGILGGSAFGAFKWFEYGRPINKNNFLSKKALLAELVDLIIPDTNSPGAKHALVHEYIINVMSECCTAREQHRFYAGLEELEDYAMNTYGINFLKCNDIKKNAVLQYYADHTGYSTPILNKVSNKLFGKPFYQRLHSLTVEGYCLSKPGATQGLAYDYIPVTYESCIALTPDQKSWATK